MSISETTAQQLQIRASQVLQSRRDTCASNLSLFFDFLNEEHFFNSLLDDLIADGLPTDYPAILDREVNYPDDYREKLRVCLATLYKVKNKKVTPFGLVSMVTGIRNTNDQTLLFLELFFNPFYDYLLEKLLVFDNLLYLLIRFKASSEWYTKDTLFSSYLEDTSKGEVTLDKKLREFLFNAGIDYPFSTPKSPSGETDILTYIKERPLPIEVKVFKGANKAEIKQGFVQAVSYSIDYNSPIGYLVVFNVSENNLMFQLKNNRAPYRITYGDKTIFIIVININSQMKTASRRKSLPPVIDEEYLLSNTD